MELFMYGNIFALSRTVANLRQDLRNMSAADKKELADVVYSGQGSAGVPAHIQKHRK